MNVRQTLWASLLAMAPITASAQVLGAPEGAEAVEPAPALQEPDAPAETHATAAEVGPPTEGKLGVAAGWDTAIATSGPNTAAARVRFGGGLTLEPSVALDYAGASDEISNGSSATTTFIVGAQIRKPFATTGPIEFLGIGEAGLAFGTTTIDPEGSDNNTTTTNRTIAARWGFGIEWWVKEHLSIGADVTNPLLAQTATKVEPEVGDATTDESALEVGANLDSIAPKFRVMLAFYN